VKEIGAFNSQTRTPEQSQIARFWSAFSNTVTPPGHWNQIAQDISRRRGFTLAQNARLFALLNLGLADASIVAWDAKYAYNFWRPVTAIRQADRDGNPATVPDADWQPLLTTPSFPEYISGHSIFSGTAEAILVGILATDGVFFSATSDTLPGVVRTYQSLREASEEIGMSRIYGGIHFLSANLDGLAAGRLLGDYVVQNFLRPIEGPRQDPRLNQPAAEFAGNLRPDEFSAANKNVKETR
jgi:membrane-associated phospholipid phosphatase